MSSKNVNSFSTIGTIDTYSNSSLLGIVSGNLTRLTSGNLVLNQVNASNLIYNTGNQNISGIKTFNLQPILSGNPLITGVDLSSYATATNLASTGNTLTTRINSLSGSSVLTYGDQTISGVKTFATGVNISGHVGIGIDSNNFDLYVRKSPAGVTVSPDGNSIAVFEGSGNSHITILAPNSASAGVVLGSPADTFGSYLTWNHDNNELKLATANPDGFIQFSTNNEAQAVRITSAGNVGINNLTPSEKLEVNGNVKVSGNLTVNNTGVLLSGSTPFVLTYGHPRDNTAAGDVRRYFGPPMDIGPVSLGSNEKRRSRVMKDCFLREVSWAAIVRDNVPTPNNAMTGYFKNFGNNPLGNDSSVGNQVTSAINLPTINETYNYSTGNLNIPIKAGDYVSFYYQTNFNAGSNNLASGLAINVDAYFYV